jgi:hypothetical protein
VENKRLSELLNSRDVKILELETELNSDDDDDDAAISGNDQFKNIVDIIGQVKDLIPSLFSGPPAIGGGSPAIQDLELNNIIAELNLIDPLFKKHMNEYLTNYKASQKNGTGNN